MKHLAFEMMRYKSGAGTIKEHAYAVVHLVYTLSNSRLFDGTIKLGSHSNIRVLVLKVSFNCPPLML